MKKLITPMNILYFILMTFVLNGFLLLKISKLFLIILIPLFIFINVFSGTIKLKTKSKRLKICYHGNVLLSIFYVSLIPSIIYHVILMIAMLPNNYMPLIYSILYCIVASAILFWNGIICVYLTSVQMGIKWRIIGAVCGMIPILNLIVLYKIINIVSEEVEFEIDKEELSKIESALEMCKTKYPILLVHGVFFRDNKYFNYWGRIPKTLEARGAKIYYGEHQSALAVKDSARELAAKIKYIVDRTGCEKVNIIAHSKGGLDCRYALAYYDIGKYVASLTTVNTPHRGCLFADKLLDAAPESLKKNVSKVYNTTLKELGDENPDFMAAVTDLTYSVCEKRDLEMTIPEGIYTQSIGSIMNKPRSGQFPLNLSYRYVKNFDGDNDGLVGETSFKWGSKYTLLKTDDKRGISHGDIIDLNRQNLKGFDVRKFYVEVVNDLKNRDL